MYLAMFVFTFNFSFIKSLFWQQTLQSWIYNISSYTNSSYKNTNCRDKRLESAAEKNNAINPRDQLRDPSFDAVFILLVATACATSPRKYNAAPPARSHVDFGQRKPLLLSLAANHDGDSMRRHGRYGTSATAAASTNQRQYPPTIPLLHYTSPCVKRPLSSCTRNGL